MKIAILNIYQNKTRRGLEVFVSELQSQLSKKHDVTVFGGNEQNRTRFSFIWRFYLDPSGLLILLFTLSKVPSLLRGNYDIIIPTNGGFQSLIIRVLTGILGKSMVISGQSGIGWDDRINLLCKPDYFVALTTKAYAWARKFRNKVIYIPNGVDLDKFKRTKRKFNSKTKIPTILCVGALVPSKNIKTTIMAVSLLKDVKLQILGEGELKEDLEKFGKEKLGDRFSLRSVTHSKIPKIYSDCDLFTLVSDSSEAFGIVYVEAMATNLPVVTKDDPQRREIVGDAGLYVINPEEISTYASVLAKALSKSWGDIPRRQAEKFGWKKISDQYEQVFLELTS